MLLAGCAQTDDGNLLKEVIRQDIATAQTATIHTRTTVVSKVSSIP
jgi:hypothetical protein